MRSRALGLPLLPVLLLALGGPLTGQVTDATGPLPQELIDRAVAFLNAPDVLRLSGGARIPAQSRVEGRVAVLGGGLAVEGEVAGDLLVVNGDLILSQDARISGNVLVIGGTVDSASGSEISGSLETHAHPLRYRVRSGRVEAIPDDAFAPGFLSTDLGFGQARITIRAGTAYNRVEGLPVLFGPVIRTAGSNPLTLEAFGIWRSVSGLNFESERMGYTFSLEQAIGGRGTAAVGASLFRDLRAIEDRGMSDLESSLSTFFLRRDLRDYYEREGWEARLRLSPARLPLRFSLAFLEAEYGTPPIRNPWTLRSSDHLWRPMSLAGEGTARSIAGEFILDTTNDPYVPSDGWWGRIGVERQVGGDLRLPGFALELPAEDGPLGPTSDPFPRFTRGSLDLRRYARVGPTSRLNLRVAASGTLTGDPLPPQLQSALGGEGTLPGHRSFSVDCGARATPHFARTGEAGGDRAYQSVFPFYGCDRTLLFQAEFQGALPFAWNPVPEEWEDSELSSLLDLQPVWALFLDAGQGWTRGAGPGGVEAMDSPTRADVGVGLFLGPFGLYWSYPLNRGDQGLNFFVRLQRRF